MKHIYIYIYIKLFVIYHVTAILEAFPLLVIRVKVFPIVFSLFVFNKMVQHFSPDYMVSLTWNPFYIKIFTLRSEFCIVYLSLKIGNYCSKTDCVHFTRTTYLFHTTHCTNSKLVYLPCAPCRSTAPILSPVDLPLEVLATGLAVITLASNDGDCGGVELSGGGTPDSTVSTVKWLH